MQSPEGKEKRRGFSPSRKTILCYHRQLSRRLQQRFKEGAGKFNRVALFPQLNALSAIKTSLKAEAPEATAADDDTGGGCAAWYERS